MQTHLKKQFRFMALGLALVLFGVQFAYGQSVSWCSTLKKSTSISSGSNSSINWATYKYCGCYSYYNYAPVLSVSGATTCTNGATLTVNFSTSTTSGTTYTVYSLSSCGSGSTVSLTSLGSGTSTGGSSVTISLSSSITSATYIAIVSGNTSNNTYKTFSSATLACSSGGGGGGGATCSASTYATTASKTDATATITQKNALASYSTAYLWVKTPGSSSFSYTNKSTSFWSSSSRGSFTYSMTSNGTYYFVATGNNTTTPTDACDNIVSVTYTAPSCVSPTSVTVTPVSTSVCAGGSTSATIYQTGGTCSGSWEYNIDGGAYTPYTTASALETDIHAGSHDIIVRCSNGTTCSKSTSITIGPKTATSITTHPAANTAICSGATTDLSVQASGAGTLHCTWTYSTDDGNTWADAPGSNNSATYTTPNTLPDGSYKFKVTVEGDCGTVTSNEANVTIGGLTITSQPTDVTICESGSPDITVAATGIGEISYYWQYSDDYGSHWLPAEGTNNQATYSIVSAYPEGDNYRFRVTVSDDCGGITSDVVTLRVISNTTITTQPTNTSVCEGETKDLSIAAVGMGTMTYTWLYSDDNGANWTDAEGTNDQATYALPTTLAAGGNHQYKVVVHSNCGDDATSNVITVTVNQTTAITSQTDNTVTVCENESGNISVNAVGENLSYHWLYSNNMLTDVDAEGGTDQNSYTTPTTLTVGENHKYKVEVSGECGNVTSDEVTVYITSITDIGAEPAANTTVCENESDILSVSAVGTGTITYAWKYSNDNGANWTNAPGTNNLASYNLPTDLEAGGNHQFKVIVHSDCGEDKTSDIATVTVTPATAITEQPAATTTICAGGTSNLSVTATGTGTVLYTWQYSDDNGANWFDAEGTNDEATYEIPNTLAAGGNHQYKVVVSSDCGEDVTSDVATVNVATETTITTQPENTPVCDGTPAKLTVAVSGAGTITYAWKYSEDGGISWTNAEGTNDQATYNLPGTLTPGDIYDYKVDVHSDCGDASSNIVTVTVSAPPTVTINGTTSICENGSTVLTAEGAETYVWEADPSISDVNIANPTFTPTGTTTYTVKGTDANGCSNTVSQEVEVKLAPSITTQPADAVVCYGEGTTLSVVATGSNLSYQWKVSTDDGNTWNDITTDGDAASYNVATTTAAGTYKYKVAISNTECGTDATSDVATVIINALPTVTINGESAYTTSTVSGTDVNLTAAGADSYEWQPNTEISATTGADVTVTPTATRTYTVTGSTTTAGKTCTADATAEITVQYRITVLANNNSYGTLTGNNTLVDDGGSVNISASPEEGYHFVEWNEDHNTSASRIISDIHANATYTANFAINNYTVTVKANEASMGTVSGEGSYNHGEIATLKATPNGDYIFLKWNDGNKDNPRYLTVTKTDTYTATFVPSELEITALANNNDMGTVTGSGTYDYMSTATITAVPNDGYCFVRWADNNIMSNRKVTVTGAKTYYAIFEPRTYRITTKNDEKGTVTGGGNYKFNETVTITAIPNEGCHFEKWNNGSTENPITFNATKNEVFSAVFSATACKLEVQANDSKMGTVTGAGTFDYNKTVTVKANPRNGYEFVKWEDGSTDAVRNITLTQDTLLTANFAALTYTLATDVNNPAMGSVEGAGNYEFATKATLTAKANIGYRFIEWHDGNSTNPRTITIYGDTTYTATFAESKYIVSVKLDNKQGKVTGAGNYDYNSTATLSVTPAEGFLFDSWADGNTDNPRTITVTQDTLLTVNMVSIKPFSENSLYYEVVSVSPATVKVRPENTKRPYYTNEPSGDIVIPETITDNGTTYTVVAIGEMAFRYCKDITSIKLPETVTRIEDYAFTDCSSLEQINIPASVTYVGKHAFRRCAQLTEAPMGEGVETINDYAYCNLNVEAFEIPANVKTLGFAVFRYANKLTKIVCKATVPPTVSTQGGEFTKYDVPLYVPAGSINAYKSHAEWGKFKTINAIE